MIDACVVLIVVPSGTGVRAEVIHVSERQSSGIRQTPVVRQDLRGGIQSVHKGQGLAARALGLSQLQALREVIVRSMAQTFSTAELGHLTRFLEADEARSMIEKTQSFQSILTKEFLAASVSDPELIRILIGN